MSRQINQPINQVRLTNVAVVRMNHGGKRFEIACYRNKVVNYRQGLEQDLSEVLQTDRIFTNVSKGQFAKAKDLQKVFGTSDEEEIAKRILTKGQLQVSDKERAQQLEKTNAQVAEWISKNCVHPTSDRPYTISQIRHAMQQANFSVHPTKPLKRQYLDCVKLLQTVFPIQRAKMKLLVFVPPIGKETIEQTLQENDVEWTNQNVPVDSQDSEQVEQLQYEVLVDPSLYRVLNEVIQTIGQGRIEILMQVVTQQGDSNLEVELERNNANRQSEDSKQLELERLSLTSGSATTGIENDDSKDDHNISSEDELHDVTLSRRKQQKKNRKKKNKSRRREEERTTDTVEKIEVQPEQNIKVPQTVPKEASGNHKSCNTCGGSFESDTAYRSHFKSDWHRFNQKLKLKGLPAVSEQEFLICDSEL